MSRVVVVGAGFAGLAAALRCAKQGHDVLLLERGDTVGGALGRVSRDGFTWDAGPDRTLLPAVVRDLFRKTGRPLERELELVPLDVLREHRFADGSTLRLAAGRSGALRSVDALAPGLGRAWVDHVAGHIPTWEALRPLLEHPAPTGGPSAEAAAVLAGRTHLERALRRGLPDPRLRTLAAHPFVLDGHHPRDVPAWAGLVSYLEQTLGTWVVPGGLAALGERLALRLDLRGVEVRTGTRVTDVRVERGPAGGPGGRVVGVRTDQGDADADVVVVATDPRALPGLADGLPGLRRTLPALPPRVVHLGLDGADTLDAETVLHPRQPGRRGREGDPLLVVRPGGSAPEGASAWTVLVRGALLEDLPTALARRGLDVRDRVRTTLDRSPAELVTAWHGSPLGTAWAGRRTRRTPVRAADAGGPEGLLVVGAHAAALPGLPFAGLTAAVAAELVGRAERA
ncbi:FAD-dependent oxidoreductase [Nocardioides sp. GY 10127]|uniref:phytoene desaturase family protein n=1 Tax=Nocardioides sp. GY 10127 TaxID=2569762 RepID=UPI0010A7E3D1|nr:FAD-dependent oxidoreductase [Nocardioides sp. GY 10127]TIC80960.1 FAD-dependent oxidoreductase [Nocardioides sp. GY 10127]